MREKINKLANGILPGTPFICVEPKAIYMDIASGETQKCILELKTLNNALIKGLAYSSDTRVKLDNSSFGGNSAKITVEITLYSTDDAEEYSFSITLITNGGEFSIPVSVHRKPASSYDILLSMSSIGDFAKIVSEDKAAALKIFEYSSFCKAPFMSDLRYRALYSNLIQNSNHEIALEQFLSACGIQASIFDKNNDYSGNNDNSPIGLSDSGVKDSFEIDRRIYFKKHYYEFAKLRLFREINGFSDNELADSIDEELARLSSFSSFHDTAILYKAENEYIRGNDSEGSRLINSVSESVLANRQDNIKNYFLYEYLDIVINNKQTKIPSFLRLCRKFIEEEKQLFLFYFVIKLDKDLCSSAASYHSFLSEIYTLGCRSPYLYYFNTQLINSNPDFLFSPKSIDNQTINFARKYNILSENIGTAVLNASCSAYIKSDRRSVSVHKTYSDAIDADLSIIGLYEYYMYSLPKDINYAISDKVINHYKNEDNLELQSRIRLYSYIVKYKSHNSAVFRAYENRIYNLAFQQLKAGNVDIYLAELYKGAIKPENLDRSTADNLLNILNTYLIQTDNKYIKNVLVIYPQFSEPETYLIKNGQANVTIFDSNAELLFQDVFGNRYYECEYKKSLLLQSAALKNAAERISQNNRYIKANRAEDLIAKKTLTADDAALLENILYELSLSEGFKALIINRLIQYYNLHTANGYNPEFLLRINKKNLNADERRNLCNAYISCNCFREAYDMVAQFGTDGITPKNLRYLCSNLISMDLYADDQLLLDLAGESFNNNLSDSVILDFLAKKYNGKSEMMFGIAAKCIDNKQDTYDLEERLLAQYIFINDYIHLDKVFNWYVSRKKVSESLVKAYFTVKTSDYFLNDNRIDNKIFVYLEDSINESGNMDEIPVLYRLALLKKYAEDKDLNEFRITLSEGFIKSLNDKRIVFPFFKQFEKFFDLPDPLRNSVVLTYKSNNGIKPSLLSKIKPFEKDFTQDSFNSEFMNVFIKSKLLFSDESWEYQVFDNNRETVTKGSMPKSESKTYMDRYSIIDRICTDCLNDNEESVIQHLREYIAQDNLVNQLFNIS